MQLELVWALHVLARRRHRFNGTEDDWAILRHHTDHTESLEDNLLHVQLQHV